MFHFVAFTYNFCVEILSGVKLSHLCIIIIRYVKPTLIFSKPVFLKIMQSYPRIPYHIVLILLFFLSYLQFYVLHNSTTQYDNIFFVRRCCKLSFILQCYSDDVYVAEKINYSYAMQLFIFFSVKMIVIFNAFNFQQI